MVTRTLYDNWAVYAGLLDGYGGTQREESKKKHRERENTIIWMGGGGGGVVNFYPRPQKLNLKPYVNPK
jgi:hypothetical protein